MQNQLIPVPFYEDIVVLVGHDNQPFVAMRSVVESMGLAWQVQHRKLVEKYASTVTEMVTVAEDGKPREMVCLPLRKLPAWLYSISPNKVKPELRDKIIRYQEECDDALWDYWTKGSASRACSPNVTQQIALSRHRIALLKELYRTRDNGLRAALHEQLAQTSRQLGLLVPDLESIGKATPLPPNILVELWGGLEVLRGLGVSYDHSKKSSQLAINLNDVAKKFKAHSIKVQLDSEMRAAMQQSTSPRFLRSNHAVHSAITQTTIKCWIFEHH